MTWIRLYTNNKTIMRERMARANIFIKCKIKSKIKKRIIKKWLKRFIYYYRKPSNEFGFMVLSLLIKWTYFPANIFIDDGGLWTNIGNKKIILFQTNNDEDRDFNKIVPMSIENEPKILVKNEKINLKDPEVEQIKDFIRKSQIEIVQLANDKISKLEFSDKIRNK